VLHTGGRTIRFAIPEPYVTLDYHAFCQAMLAQTDAAVRPHTVVDQRIDLAAAVPSGRVLATTSCEEHRA
jgi:hypothetical protein